MTANKNLWYYQEPPQNTFTGYRINIGYDLDGNQVRMINGRPLDAIAESREPAFIPDADHWFQIWEDINNERSKQEHAR